MGATPKKLKRWKHRAPKLNRHKIFLNDGFVIVVEYWFKEGQVTRFATVLIRPHDDGDGSDEICRYDTAHDYAHLDILDHNRKVIKKMAIVGLPSYERAISYAISDLKANYQKYWEDYSARKNKTRE